MTAKNQSSVASATPPIPIQPFPFTHLPLELQLITISHLPRRDAFAFRLTNHFYQHLTPAPTLSDFLAIEDEAWNLVPHPIKLYKQQWPKWLVCHHCQRYRPARAFFPEKRGHPYYMRVWYGGRLCMTCQLRPDSTYGTSIGEVEVEVEDHQVQEESLERSLGSKEGESILAWLASRHGILVRKTRKVFCRAHKSDRVTKGGLP